MFNKKLLSMALCGFCVLSMSVTAFAMTRATNSFNFDLPSNGGDIETPLVRKETAGSNFDVFNLTIDSSETDKVCAWTENSFGGNLSSPYKQISAGSSELDYYDEQSTGTKIKLNLDNPVIIDTAVGVTGSWTPN